jgi:hypothetical protein
VLAVLPVLVWTAWYSLRRDGTLVPAVYGGSFTTPIGTGLYGLVLSPGKGLFAYNPFLLLAIPGAVALWRRDRAATALLVGLMVARTLLYARWSDWPGGIAWGPRFLMPAVGPLALLAVYGVSRIPRLGLPLRVPAVAAVVALVVAGGVVNVASVWGQLRQLLALGQGGPGRGGRPPPRLHPQHRPQPHHLQPPPPRRRHPPLAPDPLERRSRSGRDPRPGHGHPGVGGGLGPGPPGPGPTRTTGRQSGPVGDAGPIVGGLLRRPGLVRRRARGSRASPPPAAARAGPATAHPSPPGRPYRSRARR